MGSQEDYRLRSLARLSLTCYRRELRGNSYSRSNFYTYLIGYNAVAHEFVPELSDARRSIGFSRVMQSCARMLDELEC